MEKVSIVIPTYKRGAIICSTLPSYLSQKYVKEIIIVDDRGFAFPYIKDLLKKNEIIRYFSPKSRLGVPAARNFGILQSRSNLVFFGEDDVELTPNYVQILLENMKKEGADIIGGRQLFVYQNESKEQAMQKASRLSKKNLYVCYPIDINFSVNLEKNITIHTLPPCSLFKREVFRKVLYDESYNGNYHREETDLYISALEKGFKLVLCNSAFAWHLNCLSCNTGGTRMAKRLALEISLLKNNRYFWKKHYKFLRKYLGLKAPMIFYVLKYSIERYFAFVKNRLWHP